MQDKLNKELMLPEEIERHQRSKNVSPGFLKMNLVIQNRVRKFMLALGQNNK
jgi:hypothetical protein